MVRRKDPHQDLLPKGQGRPPLPLANGPIRQPLAVALIKAGNEIADEVRCLTTDIPFRMNEHFQKVVKDQFLLRPRHIGHIFIKNGKVGAYRDRIVFRPQGFQHAAQIGRLAKHVHDFDVMPEGQIFKNTRCGFCIEHAHPGRTSLWGPPFAQADVNAVAGHKGLKIRQTVVDPLVALALGGIYIVQLV